MGLLDILQGNNSAASPWSALYPSPLLDPNSPYARQMQLAPGQAPDAQTAGAYGMLGIDPSAFPQVVPPQNAFDPTPQPMPVPAAPPSSADALFGSPSKISLGGAPAAPFGFGGMSSLAGQQPPAPQPGVVAGPTIDPNNLPPSQPAPLPAPVANANAAAPGTTPAADAEADPVNVGNYSMPRIGKADDFEPDEDETPAKAVPTQGAAPGTPATPAPLSFGGPSIGDRLEKAGRGFFGNMGLGPIGMIAGGLGALVTGKSTDPQQIALERANATLPAMKAAGASPAELSAYVNGDQATRQALLNQYFGADKWEVKQTGETPMGKTFELVNTRTGDHKPLSGTGGGAGPGGAATGAAAFNLPPVYDPQTRRDEAFINALDPVTKEVVNAADRGDNIPQGRNLQKYMPVIQRALQGFDPTTYLAKQAFAREMGSGKSGYGFQVKGFQQGLEHMTRLADRMAAQGNWNGLGFPDLASAANTVRQHASNDASANAGAVENDAQALSGEVGKLFSGSQGGGVHERELTRGRFGTRLSGPEQAAALESTLELMQGGLSSIEQARDRAYNGNAPAQYNFVGPQQQAQIDHIRQVIQQLRSGRGAPTAAPGAAPALPPGWSVKVN